MQQPQAVIQQQHQTVDQSTILQQVAKYSKLKGLDESFIKQFNDGYCSGISSLWLYGKWLQGKAVIAKTKQRDDYNWFKLTAQAISDWDGKQESLKNTKIVVKDQVSKKVTSEESLEQTFERFISYVSFFQNPHDYLSHTSQGKLEDFVQQTKTEEEDRPQNASKEYAVTALVTLGRLKLLLKQNIIFDDQLVRVTNPDHATAIFKRGNSYFYFDPNSLVGEIECKNTDQVAELIFNAHFDKKYGNLYPLTLSVFSFDKSKKAYPQQADVLKNIGAANAEEISAYKAEPALYRAVAEGSIECIKYYLSQLPPETINTMVRMDGRTLLQAAAIYNQAESIEALLKFGANINGINNSGQTALMMAIQNNNPVIAELLITSGANIDLKNNRGQTALDLATKHKMNDIIFLIQSKKQDQVASSAMGIYRQKMKNFDGECEQCNIVFKQMLNTGKIGMGFGDRLSKLNSLNYDLKKAESNAKCNDNEWFNLQRQRMDNVLTNISMRLVYDLKVALEAKPPKNNQDINEIISKLQPYDYFQSVYDGNYSDTNEVCKLAHNKLNNLVKQAYLKVADEEEQAKQAQSIYAQIEQCNTWVAVERREVEKLKTTTFPNLSTLYSTTNYHRKQITWLHNEFEKLRSGLEVLILKSFEKDKAPAYLSSREKGQWEKIKSESGKGGSNYVLPPSKGELVKAIIDRMLNLWQNEQLERQQLSTISTLENTLERTQESDIFALILRYTEGSSKFLQKVDELMLKVKNRMEGQPKFGDTASDLKNIASEYAALAQQLPMFDNNFFHLKNTLAYFVATSLEQSFQTKVLPSYLTSQSEREVWQKIVSLPQNEAFKDQLKKLVLARFYDDTKLENTAHKLQSNMKSLELMVVQQRFTALTKQQEERIAFATKQKEAEQTMLSAITDHIQKFNEAIDKAFTAKHELENLMRSLMQQNELEAHDPKIEKQKMHELQEQIKNLETLSNDSTGLHEKLADFVDRSLRESMQYEVAPRYLEQNTSNLELWKKLQLKLCLFNNNKIGGEFLLSTDGEFSALKSSVLEKIASNLIANMRTSDAHLNALKNSCEEYASVLSRAGVKEKLESLGKISKNLSCVIDALKAYQKTWKYAIINFFTLGSCGKEIRVKISEVTNLNEEIKEKTANANENLKQFKVSAVSEDTTKIDNIGKGLEDLEEKSKKYCKNREDSADCPKP
jgi:hypothetical protein